MTQQGPGSRTLVLTWAFTLERVTGIEPALSAWESVHSGPSIWPDLRNGLSVSDRESPRFTRVNGPLMARRLDHVEGRPSVFQAGHIPSWRRSCECCARSPVAGVSRWSLLLLSSSLSAQSVGCCLRCRRGDWRLAMCEVAAFFGQLDGAALVLVEAAGVIPVDSQSGNAVQRFYRVPGASACRFAVEVDNGYPRISSAWPFIGNSEQATESAGVHDSILGHLLTLMQ